MNSNGIAWHIQHFLVDYLTLQKGLSRHTILSYRDTIKLLLRFCSSHKNRPVTTLTVSDLGTSTILNFLDHLEKQRGNSPQTRNIRLACLHSFFRYLAGADPSCFDHCQRVLSIPFKRTQKTNVEYLEPEEMKAIMDAVDRKIPDGFRDYTLLSFMHNTGARVGEIISLSAGALRLERPYHVRFVGKGAKERLCPLWPETAKLLRCLLKRMDLDTKSDAPVFVNHRGQRLSRHGVRYLLAKYVRIAARKHNTLEDKRIHPHSVRHSTAMHMLQAGVDINAIRDWLGHEACETTNRYARMNLEMKRKVLNKYVAPTKTNRIWKRSERLLEWLESL